MPRWLALALLAALTPAGCGGKDAGDGRPPLLVSAASSLKTAMTTYARGFEAADVKLSFAGSDELAAQIRQGVAPDVFASANTQLPEALHAAGLVEEPVAFAANRLVLAVPEGSPVEGLDDLAGGDVDLAIGAEAVPIGGYTREVLARLPGGRGARILARVRSNEPDVAGIVGKLVQGGADAGFVYATDVEATDGALTAIDLPASLQPRVTYGVAVVRGAEHPGEARAFVEGLLGGAGREALRDAGFEPPPGR